MTSNTIWIYHFKCDRCGVEKTEEDRKGEGFRTMYIPKKLTEKEKSDKWARFRHHLSENNKSIDLCPSCFEEFDAMMEKFLPMKTNTNNSVDLV